MDKSIKETYENSLEKNNNSSKRKLITRMMAAGAIGMTMFVSGCASDKPTNAEPKKVEAAKQTTIEEKVDSQIQDTVIDKSDLEHTDTKSLLKKIEQIKLEYGEQMQKYTNMSTLEYSQLPREECSAYNQYILDLNSELYYRTYINNSNFREFRVTPVPASLDNTGQEIMDNYTFLIQNSYLLQNADYSYNKIDSNKLLSEAYANTDESLPVPNTYLVDKREQAAMTEACIISNKYEVSETSEIRNGVDSRNKPIKYIIIKATDVNVEPSELVVKYYLFIYHENLVSYNGEVYNTWSLGNMDSNTDTIVQDCIDGI